ncbi:MAG TPA: LysE family transporter [Rhodopseudomonas sp.]|uniref:LysE family transporter n=1 Tax=Rhodopseudomonas sp. TaxID=1078 RepID=UPI002ED8163F
MAYLPALFAIAMLYTVAVASPGPNFLVISQLSLSGRTHLAVQVALGIATGSVVWVVLAMAGVAAVLASSEWLCLAVRLVGAGYLMWLGVKLLLRALARQDNEAQTVPAMNAAKAWRTGLLTSLTNPKSGAFWTSVFATTFPASAPIWFYLVTALTIAGLSLGWHLGLALLFTSKAVQARYHRMRRGIDAVCGVVLLGFGVRLAVSR